jgi:hypothetical protein
MSRGQIAAMASGLHDTGEAFAHARGAFELAWLIAAGGRGSVATGFAAFEEALRAGMPSVVDGRRA